MKEQNAMNQKNKKEVKLVKGKHIKLREVEVSDAAFILSLRLDPRLNQFLSKTVNDLSRQEEWIREYHGKTGEYYFIIESEHNIPLGTVRIYDIRDDSFCWGSWIIKKDAPIHAAIESALLVYEVGFYSLGFKKAHFDVRKNNDSVVAFHKRFGARVIDSDEINFYFSYTIEDYEKIKTKYRKYFSEM